MTYRDFKEPKRDNPSVISGLESSILQVKSDIYLPNSAAFFTSVDQRTYG
jgi:hypothetical protein